MVKVDLSGAKEFFDAGGPEYAKVSDAHKVLFERTGAGSEFTGWLELPSRTADTELKALLAAAAKIRSSSQVLVVVGIGGSYLGARAAIELLKSPNYNLIKKDTPDIFFVGNSLSAAEYDYAGKNGYYCAYDQRSIFGRDIRFDEVRKVE